MKFVAKICILLALVPALAQPLTAQTAPVFKQPAHSFPQKLSWWDSTYLYPRFLPGRVTYFTDFSPEQQVLLNYNLYYAQMHMISTRGDTVQMKPLKMIKTIEVGGDIFYLDEHKGYLRVLVEGEVTLVAKTMLYISGMEYVSGNNSQLGGEPQGADIRGRPSIYDKYYVLSSAYYFVDKERKSYLPSKSILIKIFPEYKDAINDYFRRKPVNFLEEKDLIELTKFCNSRRRLPEQTLGGMVVHAHERVSMTLRDSAYRFPNFQDGVISNGASLQRRFKGAINYNLITGEMETIARGDTSKIKNINPHSTVNIDGTTYFKKTEGYIEILLNGSTQLGVVRRISLIHSQAPEASSKYQPGDVYDPKQANDDAVNFDRMFVRQNRFYLIDERGAVFAPSVSALYRLKPDSKKEIDQYVAMHQPDLEREGDLKQIVSYLAGL